MFRLLSIQQTIGAYTANPSGKSIRCTILADNTTDPLPTSGEEITGGQYGVLVAPGSVAVTPAGSIAIMGNESEWGAWL